MLVPFPIGWWGLSLIFDITGLVTREPLWSAFARFSIIAGVIAALIAALPGAIDLYSMKPSRVKKIGIWHMSLNLAITAMYIIDLIWRRQVQCITTSESKKAYITLFA